MPSFWPIPEAPERTETGPASQVVEINKYFESSGKVYDFFNTYLDRDSWGGGGEVIVVRGRFGSDNDVYWNDFDHKISFGNGSEDYENSYDIMAHEFSHGVAHAEGFDDDLFQSAILHESFADCMAAAYDYYDSGVGYWLAGEYATSGAARYLDDPASHPTHPGYDYRTELTPFSNDRHQASGIPSLAFVLASDGGSHPDSEHSTIEVNGITIEKATEALYEAVKEYDPNEVLTVAIKFQALAGGQIDGYAGHCAFASAWKAVGYGNAFWHGGGNAWKVAYLGWAYFHNNGDQFALTDSIWYSYTDHDADDGSMSVYSFDTNSWYWVSAETFPSYYDWTTTTWDTFTGSFN